MNPRQLDRPAHEPTPGGQIPGDAPPPREPGELPDQGPTGPRNPYPVDDPGIHEPTTPDSGPDTPPDQPSNPMPRY
ncbi:hypothetical protein [Microvirga massiliensis]|uniref:hypothetical protein n=1 Tax=Microvirga massiliensis TaxID=1033741 RepID=UPI00093C55E9